MCRVLPILAIETLRVCGICKRVKSAISRVRAVASRCPLTCARPHADPNSLVVWQSLDSAQRQKTEADWQSRHCCSGADVVRGKPSACRVLPTSGQSGPLDRQAVRQLAYKALAHMVALMQAPSLVSNGLSGRRDTFGSRRSPASVTDERRENSERQSTACIAIAEGHAGAGGAYQARVRLEQTAYPPIRLVLGSRGHESLLCHKSCVSSYRQQQGRSSF